MINEILKSGKVYKVYHNLEYNPVYYPRNYLLLSPLTDIDVQHRLRDRSRFTFPNLFIVCFDGTISDGCTSSLDKDCYLGELDGKDIMDIRRVMERAEMKGFKYNRKLNMIVNDKQD